MKALYHKNVAPVEVLSDGRRYKRFVREEAVSISFRGQIATGNLVNLSATGLLASFGRQAPLPGISEEVSVFIEVDGRDNVLDIGGTVVRIQIPEGLESGDGTEIAIDFREMRRSAKNGLDKIINYLLVKGSDYNS